MGNINSCRKKSTNVRRELFSTGEYGMYNILNKFSYLHLYSGQNIPKKQKVLSYATLQNINTSQVELLNTSATSKLTKFKAEKLVDIPVVCRRSNIPGAGDGLFVLADVPKGVYIYRTYYYGHHLATGGKSVADCLPEQEKNKFPEKYFLTCENKQNYILTSEKDLQKGLLGPKINSSLTKKHANCACVCLRYQTIYFALCLTTRDVKSNEELLWCYKL